jgi:tetratricopeptide (TPR) repeat protein
VPVLYQQAEFDFSFLKKAKKAERHDSRLPDEARDERNPYGLIGRDGALLDLERALRRKPAAVLITGLGGIGKTTLARGFLQWLEDTDGLGDGAFWLSFADIQSSEYVFNRMGERFVDPNFAVLPPEQKIAKLTAFCRQKRLLLVWDNFESAKGIPGTAVMPKLSDADCGQLKAFLEQLRGGNTKVLITSRSTEDWLAPENRFMLKLSGLDGEERWDFAAAILDDLGKTAKQADKSFAELMKLLNGHPLAMRVILPRLETKTSAELTQALHTNFAALKGKTPDEDEARLFATLQFSTEALTAEWQPLLFALSLHDGFVQGDLLEMMAKRVDAGLTRSVIDDFLRGLANAGLIRHWDKSLFEMHPALAGFLRSTHYDVKLEQSRDAWKRAFVQVIGQTADALTPLIHQQGEKFLLHRGNLVSAQDLASRLQMPYDYASITQSLAAFAANCRDYGLAQRLLRELREHFNAHSITDGEAAVCHQLGIVALELRDLDGAEHWCHQCLTLVEKNGDERGAARAFHQLGMIAKARRDFDAAEHWCRKSLTIKEKHGDEHGAGITYHLLGTIAHERWDLAGAEHRLRQSLEIMEKQNDEEGAAKNYHHLGMIAQDRRDFDAAEQWYRKTVAIKRKLGAELGAAIAYHQLGTIAQDRRDFTAAEQWYRKALAIEEKHGDVHGAAITYHQLGTVAQDRGDITAAEQWYRKALATFEKQGDEHSAAHSYQWLGILAQARGDFDGAEQWARKALAIREKQGDTVYVAGIQNNLAIIAQERRDFDTAEQWARKAVAHFELHGNEHGAAFAYIQLGMIESSRQRFVEAGQWFLVALSLFSKTQDRYRAQGSRDNFVLCYRTASMPDRAKLKAMWEAVPGLPQLPPVADQPSAS